MLSTLLSSPKPPSKGDFYEITYKTTIGLKKNNFRLICELIFYSLLYKE